MPVKLLYQPVKSQFFALQNTRFCQFQRCQTKLLVHYAGFASGDLGTILMGCIQVKIIDVQNLIKFSLNSK
jgi:hypothetical protein